MAKRRKSNVIEVDFTGVESGGRSVPDGRYKAKIIEWEEKEGKESGEPYIQVNWEITSDKCEGAKVRFDNYSLQPQALWRLKGLLEALGEEVPDSAMDLDMDEFVDGPECIIEVTNEKNQEGKQYPRVTGTAPLEDGGTVDEEDEGDTKPARGRKPKEESDEDERPKRGRRAVKEEEDDDEEDKEDTPKSSGSRKLTKGAKVKFRDEKGKLHKGTVEDIDGDTATVTDDADETWEIDTEDLTVL